MWKLEEKTSVIGMLRYAESSHLIVAHKQFDKAIETFVIVHGNIGKSLEDWVHFRHEIRENGNTEVSDD